MDYLGREMIPVYRIYYYYNLKGELRSKLLLNYDYKYKVVNIASIVFYTTAISLFIALFIIRNIEKLEREEFEKRIIDLEQSINLNVLNAVFKKFIHPELFKTLRAEHFSYQTYRKDAVWIFDFVVLVDGIQVKKTISYSIVNEFDKTIIENIDLREYNVSIYKSQLQSYKYEVDGKLIEESVKDEFIGENKILLQKQFQVPPKSIGTLYQTIVNKYSSFEIFGTYTTNHPLIGLKVIFNLPTGYKLLYTPTFREENIVIQKDLGQNIYSYSSAILSGQSVQYFLIKV